MKCKWIFIALLFIPVILSAQINDIKVGSSSHFGMNYSGALYDYSEPTAINIKVSVWGFVNRPGKYIVPGYINVRELISYAGGPADNAKLDDLRLYRVKPDSTQELIKFDYNDLLWGDKITLKNPPQQIMAGDILLVPGEPRLYYTDYFSMTLAVISTMISLSILILNVVRK